MAGLKHPVTPDGRYFVVRGRLWRLANPDLSETLRSTLVSELMKARSAVRSAKITGDPATETAAHHAIDVAKNTLGERGPVWWTDGLVKNTPYASWCCPQDNHFLRFFTFRNSTIASSAIS
jgi:hypothetical protein